MCKRSNALSRPVLMVRGLDGLLISVGRSAVRFSRSAEGGAARAAALSHQFSVVIARGRHLFPFRTEQLSPSAPMVLGSQGPGRVGRRRFELEGPSRPGGPFCVWAVRLWGDGPFW